MLIKKINNVFIEIKMVFKWKSIQNIRWNLELIEEVKQYLKNQTLPERLNTYMKEWRFRKLFDIFTLGDDNHIYLVIESEEDLKKNYKDEKHNALFDIDLPIKLRVVENDGRSPFEEKNKIMSAYYPHVMANGFRSGYSFHQKLSQEFLNISRLDVSNFIKNQEVKQLTLPTSIKILQPIVVEKPMIHHEMDLIDMSALSKMNNGITFVLNIIDVHSKFLWSRPLKNKSAESVAYELQNIYLNEGGPKIISSDNGPEFINEKMAELCLRFNIEQRKTREYYPQANGQVERVNKTLKDMIYAYLAQYDTKNYIAQLQFLVFNYNSAKHSTTKYTPFQLHRHRDVKFSILNQIAYENIKKNGEKMVQNNLKKQEEQETQLEEGDNIRVSSLALKDVRKKGILHKKRAIRNWSKDIYQVIEINTEHDIEKYKINIHEYEDRWFYRYELQYVDMENLNKTKTYKDREDLNFKQVYDPEKHIKELSGKKEVQNKLNEEQDELEIEEKKDEEKQEQLRKSNRNRRKVVNEFFVDF